MQAFLNFDRLTSLDERYWVIDGVTVFRRVKTSRSEALEAIILRNNKGAVN